MRRIAIFLCLPVCAGTTTRAPAQDKVYKSVTPDEMEQLLKDMNLEFKKVPSRTEKDIFFYDFTRNKRLLRLHLFRGKDIMLDTLFKDYPLDTLNDWNKQAKFGRASLHKGDKEPYTALEYNLDLLGGVSENNIRHFFKTFEEEIVAFQKFVVAPPSLAPVLPPGDDRILPKLTSESVEKIFKGLKLTYKKQALKAAGNFAYDYESNKFKIRLYYYGGRDLMLDAAFKKIPLDKVNQYNFDRKFVRAVQYNQGEQGYATLESNMDCTAGVSENMVRHFVVNFDGEVQAFADYINKLE